MAQTTGVLKAVNDVVTVDTSDDAGGVVGIQYGAFGGDGTTAATGTIVAESSNNGVEWYAKKITKNDDTAVDNLTAPGLGSVKPGGFSKVRIRLSAGASAQGVTVSLNTQAT